MLSNTGFPTGYWFARKPFSLSSAIREHPSREGKFIFRQRALLAPANAATALLPKTATTKQKKKIPRRITPHKTITRREIGYTPRCRSLLAARTQCVFDLQPAGASARIQYIHALEESPHKGEKNDDVPPGSPGRGRKRSEVVGTRGCQ